MWLSMWGSESGKGTAAAHSSTGGGLALARVYANWWGDPAEGNEKKERLEGQPPVWLSMWCSESSKSKLKKATRSRGGDLPSGECDAARNHYGRTDYLTKLINQIYQWIDLLIEERKRKKWTKFYGTKLDFSKSDLTNNSNSNSKSNSNSDIISNSRSSSKAIAIAIAVAIAVAKVIE
jgi:hypothetical protein